MTVKEWLSRARGLDKEIDALMTASTQGGEMLDVCMQINGLLEEKNRDIKISTDRLREYINHINNIIDAKCSAGQEIFNAIQRVKDSQCRVLLIQRYINSQTWERIAEDMEYTDVWVRTGLHSRALNEISKVK